MAERLHPHGIEREVYAPADLFPRDADVFRPEGDVVFHDGGDGLVIRILKDHARVPADLKRLLVVRGVHAEHLYRTFRRHEQGVDEFREGRLAAAVPSEDGDELSFSDGQSDPVHRKIGTAVAVRIFHVVKTYGFHILYYSKSGKYSQRF